jgi:uncharacterized protein (TIGR00661 family)
LKVLFCVLNWGLGHATRSVPIIRLLLEKNIDVVLASDGPPGIYLKSTFPNLPYIELQGYKVKYPSRNILLNILISSPKIIRARTRESDEIKRIVAQYKITHIISDNRYGCNHIKIPSALITHQLAPITGIPSLQWIANWMIRRLVSPFSEIWIPDIQGKLTGEMNLNKVKPPVKEIGILSRFSQPEFSKGNQILAVLSGPEPQRSIWEKTLLNQLANLKEECTLIRGLPEKPSEEIVNGVRVIGFADEFQLLEEIKKSKILITRSGYSTVMDLLRLRKKAIMVPTPGQTEQEYLARNLANEGRVITMNQDDENLAIQIGKSSDIQGWDDVLESPKILEQTIESFLKKQSTY